MKNITKLIFAALFIVIAFCFEGGFIASASESDDYVFDAIDKITNGIDFDSLSFGEGLFEGDAKTNIYAIISGDFPFDLPSLLSVILNSFFGDIKGLMAMFFSIVAIALINSVINGLTNLSGNKTIIALVNFISVAMIFALTSGNVIGVFTNVMETVAFEAKQVDAAIPVMLTLIVAGGGNASAKVLSPSVAFLIKGIVFVIEKIFTPIVILLFLFVVITSFSNNIKVTKARDFLKSCFKWVIGITVILFNFFITVEGITTSLYDGVSVKALKYALQSSVPIIGGIVNGGFDVTVASVLLIKNAVGMFCLISILFVSLTPILKIAALMLFLRLLSAVCEPIGDVKITQFLSGSADVLGYLNAICILSMLCFMVTYLVLIFSLSGAL
ncbi:MAG: stage III sporulation protein AE [Christensenellaceae bacterium]